MKYKRERKNIALYKVEEKSSSFKTADNDEFTSSSLIRYYYKWWKNKCMQFVKGLFFPFKSSIILPFPPLAFLFRHLSLLAFGRFFMPHNAGEECFYGNPSSSYNLLSSWKYFSSPRRAQTKVIFLPLFSSYLFFSWSTFFSSSSHSLSSPQIVKHLQLLRL